MKKVFCMLLVLAVFLGSCSAAFADGDEYTVKPYADYESLFTVDVNTEKDVAFVETTLEAKDCAFTHKYESSTTYSAIYNDILVLDYSKSSRYPLLRTWIIYAADKAQNIKSVTFELEGQSFTFTDISNEDRVEKSEKGYTEKLLIKHGKNNSDFWVKIMAAAISSLSTDEDKKTEAPKMKMILHGDEDIEADVPDKFWFDFGLLALPYISNDGAWIKYFTYTDGTPLEVK